MPNPTNRHERRAETKISAKKAALPKTVNVLETKLVFPDDIKPVFSDGLLLQFSGEIAILSFLKGMPLTVLAGVKASEIESRCVAQVALTPAQMAEDLRILNTQFAAFANGQDEDIKKFLFEKAGLEVPK